MSTDPTSFVPDINFDNNSNSNDFFDHIDHFLDFPEQNVFVGGRGDSFPSVWNASPFSCFDPEFSSELFAAELTVPCKDVAQMEWFLEDSSIDGNLLRTTDVPVTTAVAPFQLHSSSPVSVLESGDSSSSSSSISNGGEIIPLRADKNARSGYGYGRARSKRARPPTFNPESAMQLISHDTPQTFPSEQKKKRNRVNEMRNDETETELWIRKCLHCGITKTPQWRSGPMGPKTLCNACGVRHKSGRLFPEYRPAASPTFVPSLHSNCHKKVIEMRISSVNVPPTATVNDTTT